MSSYSEKLRDPRWQRRRLEIMQLAHFRCEECDAADQTLTVHHRVYRVGAEPWCYPDWELVCLCEQCHRYEHDMPQEERDGYNSESVEAGYMDRADERLAKAKFDREAQALGFKDDFDRQYQAWKESEEPA